MAREHDTECVVDEMPFDIELAVSRDKLRGLSGDRCVGENVIRMLASKYLPTAGSHSTRQGRQHDHQ